MSTIKPQSLNQGIACEVDGEIISLNPNSAEGKALARIRNPISENEWITVGEIGQDIDMEAVRERIKQRGYKIQVSSEDSSTGKLSNLDAIAPPHHLSQPNGMRQQSRKRLLPPQLI